MVALLFSVAFGAMLLSVVLWDQDVWGWSALRTGLAIAPGPLMVPLFSFLVAGRLIARFGPRPRHRRRARPIFAAGAAWWALAVGLVPTTRANLGGMLLTGVGVGLTLPTLMATAAASLPPRTRSPPDPAWSTCCARSVWPSAWRLVAVLGTPDARPRPAAFHGWWVVAGIAATKECLPALYLLRHRRCNWRPRRSAAPARKTVASGNVRLVGVNTRSWSAGRIVRPGVLGAIVGCRAGTPAPGGSLPPGREGYRST